MMKRSKRILMHPTTQKILCTIVAGYMRLVGVTMRLKMHTDQKAEPYIAGTSQAIFAFWHGRLFLMPLLAPKKREMHVLISRHNDGRLIARTIAHLGIKTIEGSTSKGGSRALRNILKALQSGHNIGITPDGPRGPAHKAAPGIIYAAKISGEVIIPVAYATNFAIRFNSWDRFILPLPFARINCIVGPPLRIEKTMTEEDATVMVEQYLNQITEKADTLIA